VVLICRVLPLQLAPTEQWTYVDCTWSLCDWRIYCHFSSRFCSISCLHFWSFHDFDEMTYEKVWAWLRLMVLQLRGILRYYILRYLADCQSFRPQKRELWGWCWFWILLTRIVIVPGDIIISPFGDSQWHVDFRGGFQFSVGSRSPAVCGPLKDWVIIGVSHKTFKNELPHVVNLSVWGMIPSVPTARLEKVSPFFTSGVTSGLATIPEASISNRFWIVLVSITRYWFESIRYRF